jgi:peptidoglycan hydrolase FlgJ
MDAIAPIGNVQQADKQAVRLRKACQDFESLLIGQMLKSMRETVPKNDVFGSREKEEIFQSMLDEQTAIEMSKTGALGLADMLYSQLSKLTGTKEETK